MLGLLNLLYHYLDWRAVALFVPAAFILAHLVPYLLDPHGLRKYPGPFFAKFTDVWLGWVCKNGHRSEIVHEMHKKYGP
jgi:benzoate 4-monooxygenase